MKDGMDITLCKIQNNKDGTYKLEYAGANNPLWILRKDEIEEISTDRQPVAHYEFQKAFTNHTVFLEQGDTFFIFSDGYADQFGGPRGKKYRSSRLKQLIQDHATSPVSKVENVLRDSFIDWKGDLEQLDDVCINRRGNINV